MPGNAVATVDGTSIEKAAFDHWLTVASKSGGQAAAAAPKPPDFAECVERRSARRPRSRPRASRRSPTRSSRRSASRSTTRCATRSCSCSSPSSGSRARPKEQGIKVSDAEVQKTFDKQKKEAFPKEADFEKFLKDSGQTEDDILQRVRLDTLSTKIREKVTKGKDKVTDAEIEAYYNKNKARFAQPERRDLRIVLTKTKAKAKQAKAAIESGQAFGKVAKKYSIDQASKAQGGKLPAVAKGQQEKALDDAIFNAKKGELTGPVKTQFGYYVFEVTKVTPASQQTLAQAKATIKQTLASQNQQKALDKFVKSFRKRWKAKTDCADALPRRRTARTRRRPRRRPTCHGRRRARPRRPLSPRPRPPTERPQGLRSGG